CRIRPCAGGYGLRDSAGNIEYKNDGGSWVTLDSLGGISGVVLDTGDTMTGPLYIDYDTSTATLHVKDGATAGNAAFFEDIGKNAATATVYVKTNNTSSAGYAIHAENTGSGVAGMFETGN
ncbi:unnamed protein product, partial [marine sediment metagenome]